MSSLRNSFFFLLTKNPKTKQNLKEISGVLEFGLHQSCTVDYMVRHAGATAVITIA